MPDNVRITVKGVPMPTGDQFVKVWSEVTMRRMETDVKEPVVSMAQGYAPVFDSTFKNSITGEVKRLQAPIIVCSIFSTDNAVKAQVIEGVDERGNHRDIGRSPGTFAPVDVIREWVRRKFALTTESEVKSVGFLVNRKIKERGIEATRPISRAIQARQSHTDALFTQFLPQEVDRRLFGA